MDGATDNKNQQGAHDRGAEMDRGSEAAWLVFTLPSPELRGDSRAAQPPHVGTGPGSFSWSLQEPLATSPPTHTFHTCSAEASRSAAAPWCTGPASTGSWGEGQGHMPSAPGPARPARSPATATYAFWLTMLRRSTTTDRSLMATAESTDVCANRAPVSKHWGQSGP